MFIVFPKVFGAQSSSRRAFAVCLLALPSLLQAAQETEQNEVVHLEKLVVKSTASEAASVYGEKQAQQAQTETLSGPALDKPAANNASDLLRDTAGVSVSRGADGATNLGIRGMDSRFVRVTVDGQRQGGRGNPLDSLPPEIVQSLQITKSITPDMDADALGGAINVVTQGAGIIKSPYIQGRFQLAYAPIEPKPGFRDSLTIGRPVAWLGKGSTGGLLATLNVEDMHRRRENNETDDDWPDIISPGPSPYSGQAIPAYTLARHEITMDHRQRYSALFNTEARLGGLSLYFRSNFSHERSKRVRERMRFDVSTGTPVYLSPLQGIFSHVKLQRRMQDQTVGRDGLNFSFGGELHRENLLLSVQAGLNLTHEQEPHTLDVVFESDHSFRVGYDMSVNAFRPVYTFVDESAPGDASTQYDPAHYLFNSFSNASNSTRDREASLKTDIQRDFGRGVDTTRLKFGFKVQERHRVANYAKTVYDPLGTPISMLGFVETPLVVTQDGFYRYGPIPSTSLVGSYIGSHAGLFQIDRLESGVSNQSADYTVTEDIAAAYALVQWKRGPLTLLGGVRLEDTQVKGAAQQLLFDTSGLLTGSSPVSSSRSYAKLLPGFHARYDLSSQCVLRSSVTEALARPSYSDLVPTHQFNFVDGRVQSGNPALRPYQAINYDLSLDRYNETWGLFSCAVFAKQISRFIVDTQEHVTIAPLGDFLERRRINGGRAHVTGAEFSWKANPRNLLSGWLKSTPSIALTFLQSGASIPDRPGESIPLPGQARRQYSFNETLEHGPAALTLTARYRSRTLESVVSPGRDLMRTGGTDYELSFSEKLSKTLKLQLSASNLSKRSTEDYTGIPSRIKEVEINGREYSLSLQWKI